MEREDTYIVPLKDLEIGDHDFHYTLDDKFFETVDGPEVQSGNVQADITVRKTLHSFLITFNMEGTVKVLCDRCLNEMDQAIACEENFTVKFGEDKSEEDDKLVIVSEEEGEIDLSWYMYEFIALQIPIRHIHEAGECDEEMAKKLRKHLTYDKNELEDSDDGSLASDVSSEESEDDSEREIDPRWNALKKLLDNK